MGIYGRKIKVIKTDTIILIKIKMVLMVITVIIKTTPRAMVKDQMEFNKMLALFRKL